MSPADKTHGRNGSQAVGGVVTRLSPWSVEDTVARLQAVLAARGVKLFTIIDQSAEAEAVGLTLRNTKLAIFGSPKAGTALMQAVPLAALDLPLKVLVWEDDDKTKISYLDPTALAERYHLDADLAKPIAAVPALVDVVVDR